MPTCCVELHQKEADNRGAKLSFGAPLFWTLIYFAHCLAIGSYCLDVLNTKLAWSWILYYYFTLHFSVRL